MKTLKYFFGLNLIGAVLFLSFSAHLTSCIKEVVHDTTTVTVRDTLKVTDTVCHVDVGMVAHYTFTNGSLLDESGNNNNIVYCNATKTTGRTGIANSAYLFNGSDAYMRVANSASLNPDKGITMVAVFKANDFYLGTCHGNDLISKGYPDPVNGFYVMRITDPFGHCYDPADTAHEFMSGGYGNNSPAGTAAGAYSDTSIIRKGQWYVAVYTFDGNESKLYVNGELKAVDTRPAHFTANDQDLLIGKHGDPSFPYLFNGIIDEIRIYNRALCECEIQQLNNYDQKSK